MNSTAKSKSFDTIKKARELIKTLSSSTASAATLQGYEQELNRLMTKNQTRSLSHIWPAICGTRSKRTYYRRVAATRHFARSNLELALRLQDKQQRSGDEAGWLTTVTLIDHLVVLLQTVQDHEGKCPIADPVPRHSKRQDLRGLPDDWREQMHDAMKVSKYRVDYLVAALTGCRPEELQRGVEVSIGKAFITFKINGAKVKANQGQPLRKIEYNIDSTHPLVRALIEEMRSQEAAHAIVKIEKKENFTSALRRVGKKLWPRRRAEITPYCLRHAAANDFKLCLSPEDVSKALGHAVDATASIYGQRQMSRSGGLLPAAIYAERAIKSTLGMRPDATIKSHF